MDYRIFPPEGILETTVSRLPLSKSVAARLLILNALTPGAPSVSPSVLPYCTDTDIMRAAVNILRGTVHAGDNGTALRFLTAYYAATEGCDISITGSERLCMRPLAPLIDTLRALGADIEYAGEEGFPPLKISGRRLSGGSVDIDASVSSQFVSARMMITPLLDNGLTLRLLGDVKSLPYISMTAELMRRHGVAVNFDRDKVEEARGNFEINITEYVVNKPAELGQEFYDKVFGPDAVHNEEEYRARVTDMIAQGLQPNSRNLFVRTTEDYLMETYGASMQLPEGFLRKFMMRANPEIKEEEVDGYLQHSIPGIKWEIIQSQAGRAMNIRVEEDDVKAIARSIAMEQLYQYGLGQMAEQMADYYAENLLKDKEQLGRIREQAFTAKLMNAIHNAVKLNEKTVSLDEFRAIVDTLNNASGAEVAAEESAE